jgi:hypothetical protein
MTKFHNAFTTTRLSIWLLLCALILAATSVYAAGDGRPLAAVDILGSPDAAVNGQFAVGTSTPGNKALTVAGVIDFVGAGTVHNYFTQGPGNNMQIRSNVDEVNSVGDASRSQWNMVMGSNLDVFSIRRSPAGAVYNEDALFWIDGNTGRIGIATVDTSNGASIPFTLLAKLHVETDWGDAILGVSNATLGHSSGVYGESQGTNNDRGVYGYATSTTGVTYGVLGKSDSSDIGFGVYGYASSSNGQGYGVYGISSSTSGIGVLGFVTATSGTTYAVYGESNSDSGKGVYGRVNSSTGITHGVYGLSNSTSGVGVLGYAGALSGTNYGVYGNAGSLSGYDFYAAGAGTDYGPFTGAHEVLLSDTFPVEVKPGLIVSGTGEAHLRQIADGEVDLSSTLPTVRLADTIEDPAVLGVLVAEVVLPEDHWYASGEEERFATVNALGEGRVWVTNISGGIKAGEYITSSAIPGYGQRQDDDILHSYTLAKAMETVDWDTVTETVIYNGQEYKIYLLAVVYTSG